MEMPITKSLSKILAWILGGLIAIIAGLLSAEGSQIGILTPNCLPGQFWCVIEINVLVALAILGILVLIVFLIPVIVDLVIAGFKFSWPRLVKFFKTANPNNITLRFETTTRAKIDEVLLTIQNDEWRFDSLLAFADVLLLRAEPNDEQLTQSDIYKFSRQWDRLKWITTGKSQPVELKLFESQEVEFLKLDFSKKMFYINTDDFGKTEFGAGIYQFIIKIVMFETKLHIRNGLPSRFRLNRTFSLTIHYDGANTAVLEEIRDATNDEANL